MSRILGSFVAAALSWGIAGIAPAEESDRAVPLPPPPPQVAAARVYAEAPRPRRQFVAPRVERTAARPATDPNRAARIHEAIALLKAGSTARDAVDHKPIPADLPLPPESLRLAAPGEVPFGK